MAGVTTCVQRVGVQPVLNVSFDMEKSHFLFFFIEVEDAQQSPLRYIPVAVTTRCETLILLVI